MKPKARGIHVFPGAELLHACHHIKSCSGLNASG
jgi:hypothetical protein